MDVKRGDYFCCALCPTKLVYKEKKELKEGGFAEVRNTDNYGDVRYLLSNGSKMRIGVCGKCNSEAHREESFEKLMESVIDGWKHSITDEKEEEKMYSYFKDLKIVGVCQN